MIDSKLRWVAVEKEVGGDEGGSYLPTWRESPRKMAPIMAAIPMLKGLNIATKIGPFLCMHQEQTQKVTTFPTTAFGERAKMKTCEFYCKLVNKICQT